MRIQVREANGQGKGEGLLRRMRIQAREANGQGKGEGLLAQDARAYRESG